MSISRSTFLMAVVAAGMLSAPAWADDLAAAVAAQLRDSGALVGYRVHVKAKSGTVWLEGTVSDEKQLATAVDLTEATPGVERVVNRLMVESQKPAGNLPLGVPASAWGMSGLAGRAEPPAETVANEDPRPAAEKPAQPEPTVKKPSLNPLALFADSIFPAREAVEQPRPRSDVQLVGGASAAQNRSPQPAALPKSRTPRPMAGQAQAGRPTRQPAGQTVRYRTATRASGMGEPMTLPGPGMQDGQIVPGTVRYSEGGPVAGGGVPHAGMPGGPMPGGPVPMGGTGVGMPPVPMRGDGPHMPNYAWPSYAAYPNYAALQYPTQYSPTAWPYIGPFYPYPQVPLGWRRVSLEWDDGWWWLDFDERHYHSHHR